MAHLQPQPPPVLQSFQQSQFPPQFSGATPQQPPQQFTHPHPQLTAEKPWTFRNLKWESPEYRKKKKEASRRRKLSMWLPKTSNPAAAKPMRVEKRPKATPLRNTPPKELNTPPKQEGHETREALEARVCAWMSLPETHVAADTPRTPTFLTTTARHPAPNSPMTQPMQGRMPASSNWRNPMASDAAMQQLERDLRAAWEDHWNRRFSNPPAVDPQIPYVRPIDVHPGDSVSQR